MSLRFGSEGARGILGVEFTYRDVLMASQAYLRVLGEEAKRGLAVGYDRRFMAEWFAQTLARDLALEGVAVHLTVSPVTSPLLSALVRARRLGGGVMLTASHNPYPCLGVKFKSSAGGSEPPERMAQVEEELSRLGEVRVASLPALRSDALAAGAENLTPAGYPNFFGLLQLELRLSPERFDRLVVVDFMHGAAAEVAPAVLSTYLPSGSLTYLRREREVTFGQSSPEPVEELLSPLCEECRRQGAIGLAFDGDGDRLAVVDEAGEVLFSHEVYSVLLHHLARERGLSGTVVRTSTLSRRIDRLAERMGFEVRQVKVGFKHVAPALMEPGVLMAGEESGGFGFGFYLPERDGILAALLFLEAVQESGMGVREWRSFLDEMLGPTFYHHLDLPTTRAGELVSRIAERPPGQVAGLRLARVECWDGVKLHFGDEATLQFRASGTEPLLRIYAEADSRGLLNQLLHLARRVVEESSD